MSDNLSLSDFSGKISALQHYVTPTVLDLINRSEALKSMIRAYVQDDKTDFLRLDASTDGRNSAAYWTPTEVKRGYVVLGIDRITSPAGLVEVLTHELGHHKVEGVDGALSNARTTAYYTKNTPLYESACHLTEGFAKLAEGKAIAEILSNPATLDGSTKWQLETHPAYVQYKEYDKLLRDAAGLASGADVDIDDALAFMLGESNKPVQNSLDGKTYLEFCKNQANEVLQIGQTPAGSSAPATILSDDESGNAIRMDGGDGEAFATFTQTGDGEGFFELRYPDKTIVGTRENGDGISTLTLVTRDTDNFVIAQEIQVWDTQTGTLTSQTEIIPTATGETSTTRYYTLGTTVQLDLDKSGNILERTETVASLTGPAAVTVFDGADNEVGRGTLDTFEDGSTSQTIRYADGRTLRTNTDGEGNITSRASIQTFEEDGSRLETVSYANGRIVKLSYDRDGALLSQQEVASASLTLQNAIPSLIDALSLLKAIQSGDPLPIVASGLRLANDLSNLNGVTNLELSGAANAASSILSLMALDAALERGDTLGVLTAGAQALSFGAQAYVNFATANNVTVGLETAKDIGSFLNGSGNGIPGVLPVLSLVNAIVNGDEAGIAVSTLSVLNSAGVFAAESAMAVAIPYIGWAYAAYSMISSLFGDDDEVPDPWGSGRFIWNGTGIAIQSVGETGGNEAVANVMNSVLATMNALIERERQQNPGSQLGLIPNRMPSLGYDMSGYRYTDIDPLTGAEKHPALRFDTGGRPYNAEAGSPESWQSLIEGVVRSALTRSAIAPLWEVQTAKAQTDAGDPKAGLTEEERAGRDGQLAAPISGNTQTFRPVALDLDGDGIETSDKAHGVGSALPAVAFDVDDSGYLKATGWVKGDDAFLTLDRDYNGQFDTGRELFSNGTVALGRRGLAGMAWVDSNYDGKLTATDPVWSELKVWRDLDQDGAQDAGEVQGLDALGVSELNYAMGTFTQAGQQKQLASPDLEADKDGTRVTVVPEGILVQASGNGHLSLLVTRIDDKTAVEANRDGVSGYEDVELIVSSADLLANDTLGGFLGRDLTITGLTNLRHGTGFGYAPRTGNDMNWGQAA